MCRLKREKPGNIEEFMPTELLQGRRIFLVTSVCIYRVHETPMPKDQ